MLSLSNQGLLYWCHWFDQQGLTLGTDYHWAWDADQDCWAVEFRDPRTELIVQLKLPDAYRHGL